MAVSQKGTKLEGEEQTSPLSVAQLLEYQRKIAENREPMIEKLIADKDAAYKTYSAEVERINAALKALGYKKPRGAKKPAGGAAETSAPARKRGKSKKAAQ